MVFDKMTDATVEHFKSLTAQYTGAIRVSDFKANIVMFFLSLSMGPIIFNHDKFPAFLPLPMLVAPFLVMFFCLFVVLLPRYPKRGRSSFFISGKATPADFLYRGPNLNEAQELQLRVAILSDILYWKTLCLRIAFFICMACVVAAAPLLAIYAR
ncbi:MAG: hypothetical protein KGM15_11565 [Pseudomonadota bacterium]|nr:hypothetical protein [Pseudomonadota bacterium]